MAGGVTSSAPDASIVTEDAVTLAEGMFTADIRRCIRSGRLARSKGSNDPVLALRGGLDLALQRRTAGILRDCVL